jgi:hypothetical protein
MGGGGDKVPGQYMGWWGSLGMRSSSLSPLTLAVLVLFFSSLI